VVDVDRRVHGDLHVAARRGIALASVAVAPTGSGSGWASEVKWDDIRAQLQYDRRRVCLHSRARRDCTGEFRELVAIAVISSSGSLHSRRRARVPGCRGQSSSQCRPRAA